MELYFKSLNDHSKWMINNIVTGMTTHPRFAEWDIRSYTYDQNEGVEAIEMIYRGNVNLYLFFPKYDGSGRIGSIALYGAAIDQHYQTLSNSGKVFGMTILDLREDMNTEGQKFLDMDVSY